MFYRIVGLVTLLLVLAGSFLSPSVTGQAGGTTIQDLERRVNTFFASLKTKAPKSAFDTIVKGGPLAANKGLDQILQQVQTFDGKYGAFLEAELIRSANIGKDLVILDYLYKSERFPLAWRFVFYRPPTTATGVTRPWHLISVSFHSKLERLEKAAVATPPRT